MEKISGIGSLRKSVQHDLDLCRHGAVLVLQRLIVCLVQQARSHFLITVHEIER